MNKWIKSILIGVLATIVIYLLLYKKPPETYRGHYVVRIKEDGNTVIQDKRTIERIADNYENRFAYSNIKAEVKILNDQLIDIRFSNLDYTHWVPNIILSKVDLEFRELFTLQDLSNTFLKADTILGFAKPAFSPKKDSIIQDAGGLVTFTKGYEPETDKSGKQLASFIQFAEGYKNNNNEFVFPPYIGKVLIKDTAFVDSVFHSREILNILPLDLKFLYSPEYLNKKNKLNGFLYLYAVHDMPGNPAPVNNYNVIKARVDDSYKDDAAIAFEFNIVGAKKWERMTTDNIRKSIAIILYNEVISAPRVGEAISDGTVTITGVYTKENAAYVVSQILANCVPTTITIVKEELVKEKEPFLSGNPVFFLIVFLVFALISYLFFNLIDKNKRKRKPKLDLNPNLTT